MTAFEGFKNSTLIFQLPTGTTTTDVRGNVIPETEAVTFEVFMQEDTKTVGAKVKTLELPGTDDTDIRVSGFLVQPNQLDNRINHGDNCTVTWNFFDRYTLQGTMKFWFDPPIPWLDTSQVLGDPFRGLLKVQPTR